MSARENNPSVIGSLRQEMNNLYRFHRSNALFDKTKNMQINDSMFLFYDLTHYSETNWAGFGCDSDGVPNLKIGTGLPFYYKFKSDGIYLNNVKITNTINIPNI